MSNFIRHLDVDKFFLDGYYDNNWTQYVWQAETL